MTDSPASRCVLLLGSAKLESSFLGISFYLLDLRVPRLSLDKVVFSGVVGRVPRRWIGARRGAQWMLRHSFFSKS